ncbi:MAG: hypothetical protein JJU32_14205 [Phormidium sp. BM_Day4_Bin.17]|nr:hypothetical protein [Phormidium sp. BM_Day4_Bin.17]UCJ13237.1 MAG: hypothetical protein JWS08_05510 [Phormidium sp. PBR-2020]
MPLQHLPNSIHRVRAQLRTLASPSIWLSILGVVFILGVAWQYVDRRGVRQLAADFSLDAFNNNNDDPSRWQGEVSGEDARMAADIDSSDVLQQIISQQGTPTPVAQPQSDSDREDNINRILEILANPQEAASSPEANQDEDASASNNTASPESNLFLQGLGFDNDSGSSSSGNRPQGMENSTLNQFLASGNGDASAESLPQLTPMEQGFQQLANPRTGSLGLMQPLSGSETPQPAQGRDSQEREAQANGRNGSENGEARADGRATSAETLPAFAMPVPQAGGQAFQSTPQSETGVSTFTGYPYNPNAVQGATPQAEMGNPYGSPNPNVNPGLSGSPTTRYGRPTHTDPAGQQNAGAGNPYGVQPGGQMGVGRPNGSANPYHGTPGDVLNPNGAVFRGPVPEGTTGYPNGGAMTGTPQGQESLRNQPVEPFSVPRTPPGRSIGGGRINTFANP